jgi:hypothetical protein
MHKFAIHREDTLIKVITGASVVLLIAGAFYSSFSNCIAAIQANTVPPGEDMVSTWERRLRKARLLLPQNGMVGYIADWDLPDKKIAPKDQEIEFVLTQYTLAPLVFTRGTHQNIVVGNFNDTGDPDKLNTLSTLFGIEPVNAFSNEFYIFKGSKP